jgi:hypothetical protein
MIRIGNTIFSLDVLEKKFRCNLAECCGNCCRYGDSGAPVTEPERAILERIWPVVKSYLRPEGIDAIEKQGPTIKDKDNDLVTPLINNMECAYTILEGTVYMCGIEKAWNEGRVDFRKPLSCHLFPVRIKNFSDFMAVNYEEIAICAPARKQGTAEGVYVYEFLREPLIRALGKVTYDELAIAARELNKWKNNRR